MASERNTNSSLNNIESPTLPFKRRDLPSQSLRIAEVSDTVDAFLHMQRDFPHDPDLARSQNRTRPLKIHQRSLSRSAHSRISPIKSSILFNGVVSSSTSTSSNRQRMSISTYRNQTTLRRLSRAAEVQENN